MKSYYLVFAAFLALTAQAQETEITVLGLAAPCADPIAAANFLQSLPTYWPSSQTGITIGLASGGVPIPFFPPLVTGLAPIDLQAFMSQTGSVRNQYGADVVLFFTGPLAGVCGLAPQQHWTDISGGGGASFVPNAQGLDLRGAEDSWGTIVSTTTECVAFPEAAIHEFGHLHGAGHVGNPGTWLFSDSHAFHVDAGFVAFKTIVAEAFLSGHQTFTFSAYPGSANNRGTLVVTAQSVANYRVPQCELTTPINVQGLLVDYCSDTPPWWGWTEHILWWDDSCPKATEYFEVWASQPLGFPYTFSGTVFGEITPYYIFGRAARARVKACNSGVCTSLSSTSYLAGFYCGDYY